MSQWTFPIPRLEQVSLRFFDEEADLGSAHGIIRAIGPERLGRDLRGWDQVFETTDGIVWTARYGEAVVGFAGSSHYDELCLFHTDLIHPEAQGIGIGTALVLARIATTDFSTHKRVGLVATEHSVGFYERFGFERVGEGQEEASSSFLLYPMERRFTERESDEAWRMLEASGVELEIES